MIRLAVFDMAGTTVQEGGAVYQAIADAVAEHLGRVVPDQELGRWTGAEKREAIAGLLESLGGAADDPVVDRVFADFSTRLDDAYLAVPPTPIPGATELFAQLHRRDIKVALTTGFSNRVAEGIIDGLGWAVGVEFDALVTAEQVGAGRPSPLMIQRAATLTGVADPSEIVVVGDTVRDLEAGQNARAQAVVGVLTGAQGEEELSAVPGARVLRSCADLLTVIDELDGTVHAEPGAPAPDGGDGSRRRPNILLVTLDQFRADCLGVAGHPLVQTPTLDRLAAQGIRFANHYSNCAPCAPARASLLTGLWQMNHRVTFNGAPLEDRLPTLPRRLRELGYEPALFGYTDTALDPVTLAEDDPRRARWAESMNGFTVEVLLDEGIAPWLEWLAGHGYRVPGVDEDPESIYRPAELTVPAGRGATWRPAIYAAEHTESAFITECALDWLRRPGRSEEPWCAHVSYLRPHPPYLAPVPYHDMFDPAEVPPAVRRATPEDEADLHPFLAGALRIVPSPRDELDQRQLQATYYGMIAEVDAQLGRLVDELDELHMSENTVVVVTSDHGEQLGDHWLVEKLGFFEQSYHIPLIVRWPGATGRPGRVIESFTENVDVLPTLLDLLGAPPSEFCDGASLRPFIDADGDIHHSGWSSPPGWRTAVHHEFDFREPISDVIERHYGLRQDQCAIAVLRDRHTKYVQFCGNLPPLLFDLDDDPGELVDRHGDPSVASRELELVESLLRTRMEHTDPRLANTRATPDGTVHRPDPPR